MEDKSFYLSDLALEMLILSQKISGIPLPVSGVLKKASQEDMIKELYLLVSNGIMENNEEKGCFMLNKDLTPILKTIIRSKSVIRVADLRYSNGPSYCYLSEDRAAVVENSNLHSGLKLGAAKTEDVFETIFKNLNVSENSENVSENFEKLETGDAFFEDMLLMDIEDLKKGFGDAESCVDILSCKTLNTICRILIFKKTPEYKIAVMTEKEILLCDYTYANFCRAMAGMTRENL